MPRKLLLDDETQATILQAITSAAPLEACAGYAGVDLQTFWRWMEFGKPDQPCHQDPKEAGLCQAALGGQPHEPGACPELSRFRDFREAVERAQHALHVKLAGEIVKAAPRDWKAALEILRRKEPATWNVPLRTEFTGTLAVEVSLSARERVAAKLEELHARGEIVMLPASAPDAGGASPLDSEEEKRDVEETPARAKRASPPEERKPRVVVA
jgi:hypothetical protein